jgi:hypothetical protein
LERASVTGGQGVPGFEGATFLEGQRVRGGKIVQREVMRLKEVLGSATEIEDHRFLRLPYLFPGDA